MKMKLIISSGEHFFKQEWTSQILLILCAIIAKGGYE